jgi:hypothetical protein
MATRQDVGYHTCEWIITLEDFKRAFGSRQGLMTSNENAVLGHGERAGVEFSRKPYDVENKRQRWYWSAGTQRYN